MECKIKVVKGKVVENEQMVKDMFTSLDDGAYYLSITPVPVLTDPRSCQNDYFRMVDIISRHTGNDRYTVHASFKRAEDVPTTQNQTVKQWKEIINKFRWWAYNEFDCVV